MARHAVRIAKPQHKFAAAHFTIFPGGEAELLHGHNYKVIVELEGDLDEHGFLVPFAPLKQIIKQACDVLDERVLIPTRSRELEISEHEGQVIVRYGAREYRLPAADVIRLPIVNSTSEALADHLLGEIERGLAARPERARLTLLRVGVEESEGQVAFATAVYRPG